MNNIIDMVIEYTKKGKILDRHFIVYAINTLKQEKDLEDFVKRVKFRHFSLSKDDIMSYVINTRCLNVFKKGINTTKTVVDDFKITDSYERLFIINTFILKYILHELNHVAEFKASHGKKNDFESLYFRYRYFAFNEVESLINLPHYFDNRIRDNIKKHNQMVLLDSIYGKASLSERLANIKAYTDILNLITSLDKDLFNSVMVYATAITDSYLAGYINDDKVSAPTTRFIYDSAFFNIPLYLEVKDKANELAINAPFPERLKYGLPISKEEFTSVQDFSFIRARLPKKYQ